MTPTAPISRLVALTRRLAPPLVGVCVALGVPSAVWSSPSGSPSESIRVRAEALTASSAHGGEVRVLGEVLGARRALPPLYETRGWEPLWTGPEQVESLRAALETLRDDALPVAAYHLDALDTARGDDLDLLATDAFLLAGAHLVGGRVDPTTFERQWHVQPATARTREVDIAALLVDTLDASADVGTALLALRPADPAYGRLRSAHARIGEIVDAGGWPALDESTFPAKPTLEPGADDSRVPLLRRRLLASGDLLAADVDAGSEDGPTRTVYDDELVAAAERFQERHGLDADGKVGPKTLDALRVTAAERLRQIELDLERWRWSPRELLGTEPGARAVRVNLAGYDLELLRRADDGARKVELAMRVVVGREGRDTPVFSDTIRYLVLNPSWEVPTSLATRDKLPMARKDPSFLAREGFEVYTGYAQDAAKIDPSTVDWNAVPAGPFPYRLRQRPGPLNALGQVKFMFPNRFNVYLHDTPARTLFARAQRDFSSGCIRLEKPLALAEALLAPAWTRDRIDTALASGREQTVMLPVAVPVHLLHWTSWVDDEGILHVRRDLYGRNARLDAALREADSAVPAVARADDAR